VSIGGRLDLEALLALAVPPPPPAIDREIRRLAEHGLTARDIARALRMDRAAVERVLERNPPMEA